MKRRQHEISKIAREDYDVTAEIAMSFFCSKQSTFGPQC